jgi:hypothetical protein
MRRILTALVAVLAGLLLATAAAYGAGTFQHFPSDMHAATTSTYQHGRLAGMEWHWWSTYEDRWITGRYLVEPTDAGWPGARSVGKNETVEIIFDSPDKPDMVYIKSYRNPELKGEAKVLPHTVLPIKTNGLHGRVVGWDILTGVERAGPHYVTVFAKWDQTPGRHYSYGWERRQFHFKTR